MNKDIQPTYGKCKITCVCGNVIETNSTKKEMKIDTCSACHPFFTGQKQSMAKQGRAAKFMEKYGTNK
jgi:large subunit ribosomal protein L31